MKIDRGAIRRQAFGAGFKKHRLDEENTAELMAGRLRLRPHSEWVFNPRAVDWAADPFEQRNWRAQFHMLRWMDPLRRQAEAGDDEARKLWLTIAKSWVDTHGNPTAYDSFAWMDMVDAMRALALSFGLLITDSEEEEEWLVDALVQHAEWLVDPSHIGHSNHALHQHQALFVLGRALERDDWWRLAWARLKDLFLESYDSEGINSEGSIAYHKMNLQWWRDAFSRLSAEGVALPEESVRLDLAAEALAQATRPDGTFERIGDTEVSSAAGLATPETDYASSMGARGTPPERVSAVYSRGYAFGRSGWGDHERDFQDESFYSVSFGSARRVHGHADGGSITFFGNRRPWLVDSGKYGYFPERELRKFMLSRDAHNVVIVNGVPYDRDAQVELLRSRSTVDADELVFRDRGYRGAVIERRVIYSRGGDFVIVLDDIEAKSRVNIRQLFHLAPDTTLVPDGEHYVMRAGADQAVFWSSAGPEAIATIKGQTDPIQGWVSDSWGTAEEAQTVEVHASGSRVSLKAVIGSPHRNDLQVLRADVHEGTMTFAVRANGTVFNIVSSDDSLTVLTGDSILLDSYGGSPAAVLASELRGARERSSPAWPTSDEAHSLHSLHATEIVAGVKEHIYQRGESIESRLEALDVLATKNVQMGDAERDHGMRAAIVDIASVDIPEEYTVDMSALTQRREPVLTWGTPTPDMRSRTYGAPVRRFASLSDGARLKDEEVVLTDDLGDLAIAVLVGAKPSNVLTVRFHGALNRSRSVLPLFQGRTFDMNATRSYAIVQDPSLDLDSALNLAWFLGRRDVDLHRRLAELVSRLKSAVNAEHVVLSGSSGGGFAAMQVAGYLEDAFVLAINPQTDVTRYHRTSAEHALAACFGLRPGEAVPGHLRHRVSLLSRLENYGGRMRVLYVQNRGDDHHVKEHYTPLRNFLAEERPDLRGMFEFQLVDWGPGHQSTTRDEYLRLMDEAVRSATGVTN